ncbi:DUF5330 domain-containing protein [Bartonella sp. B12(2025)]
MIRFLIKLLFFLFFIFVIISFFVTKPNSDYSFTQRNSETATSDVIVAFKEALNDFGAFCDRNIKACKVGKSFLNSLGERAHYGARAAYEYWGRVLDSKNVTPKVETQKSIPKQKHMMLP